MSDFDLNGEIKKILSNFENNHIIFPTNDSSILHLGIILHLLSLKNGLFYAKNEEGKSDILDYKDFSKDFKTFEFKYNFPRKSFMLQIAFPSVIITGSLNNQRLWIKTQGINVDSKNDLSIELPMSIFSGIMLDNMSSKFKELELTLNNELFDKFVFPFGGRRIIESKSKVNDYTFSSNNLDFNTNNNFNFNNYSKPLNFSNNNDNFSTGFIGNYSNQIPTFGDNNNFRRVEFRTNSSTERPPILNFNNENKSSSSDFFFKDFKSGVEGNLVGPNSLIFNSKQNRNNVDEYNPYFPQNIRYDVIGPMGFEGGVPIPKNEQNLFGNNDFNNIDFDPNNNDMMSQYYMQSKKMNSKKGNNNNNLGFNNEFNHFPK